MKKCPITYKNLSSENGVLKRPLSERYSLEGLHRFSPKLNKLADLNLSAEEMRQQAVTRSIKMSVQGVQAKLSAVLNLSQCSLEIVDIGGRYILKPQSEIYANLPENEDLTMKLAALVKIETPFHGMIYSKDGSLTYFIKRFDRITSKQKLALEDFSQLLGRNRDSKYKGSMEQIADILDVHCTFPLVEKAKLFDRVVFSFLIGNEDMHLKNYSLIKRDGKVELSPAYDFVNTTLAIPNTKEELALPLNGKKRNLQKDDFVRYFARQRLGLTDKVIDKSLQNFRNANAVWESTIKRCFLPEAATLLYLNILSERSSRILS